MQRGEREPMETNRRSLFQHAGVGIAGAALASLLGRNASAAPTVNSPTAEREVHFSPRATNVIFLHMVGAASQLDLFDYKPVLNENNGKKMPDALWEGLRLAFVRKQPNLLGSPFKFARHGQCGMELSELLPNLAEVVDDIAMVKSLHTEQFNHAPAQIWTP